MTKEQIEKNILIDFKNATKKGPTGVIAWLKALHEEVERAHHFIVVAGAFLKIAEEGIRNVQNNASGETSPPNPLEVPRV